MYDYRCAYCGCTLDDYNGTIDHVKPKAKGGSNYRYNLMPACPKCNSSKRDLSVDEFREDILNRINSVFNGFKRTQKIVFYFEKRNPR